MLRILLFSSLLFFACSRSDDGPLSVFPEDEQLALSEGFFYSGALDFGRPIHLFGDSLIVYLDSIWTFSNCSLSEITLNASLLNDTMIVLSPQFLLTESKEDCAAPLFRPETTLSVLMNPSWKNTRQIKLVNTQKKDVDSILVRRGFFSKDTVRIFVDSAIVDPELWPFRTFGDAGLLRVLDSLVLQEFHWKPLPSSCLQVHDDCEKRLIDTIFPSTWIPNDTTLVPLREICLDTSLTYCIEKDFKYDSLSTKKVETYIQHNWYSSFYYLEPIEPCTQMIQFNALTSLYFGSNFNITRELFTSSPEESTCESEIVPGWIIYDVSRNKIVLDAVKAKQLLDQWDTAFVAKQEKP